uniref:Uncharacterized protein n=1 Tax=Chromera velia CCMP2878 TaxID=1169474 RepID=A0A0G4I2F0_9ALVE|eukprot:Cvel_10382.t1-p1 / transcript=Cvel_10382.t1 / gene=Cvel_10382 / organism=Chromera_velia_CCMP2878 / gene_product=hypothetical protein / transcript_product=hypothetical protein / location=Cvel_scaffold625:48757-51698(-) / protein_length=516 / sequence_SO=supercontig / SO=protein_coding / is_pseudo=false
MPELFVCRFYRNRWEVLLQRRSGKVDFGWSWTVPGGSDDRVEASFLLNEEGTDLDSRLKEETKRKVALRACVREFIEEAGGGSAEGVTHVDGEPAPQGKRLFVVPEGRCPVTGKVLRAHDFTPRKRNSTTPQPVEVCVPPTIVKALTTELSTNSRCCRVYGPVVRFPRLECRRAYFTAQFVIALDFEGADKGWETWRPRALPSDRWEIDEAPDEPEKYGDQPGDFQHGYLWVPLEHLLRFPETPVRGSSQPLAPMVRSTFFGRYAEENKDKIISFLTGLHGPPVSTVFLVRHCESEANSTGMDVTDALLSEKGKNEALDFGSLQVCQTFDKVVCTPLRRTVQTAAALCPHMVLQIEPALQEMNWLARSSQQRQNLPVSLVTSESSEDFLPKCGGLDPVCTSLSGERSARICEESFRRAQAEDGRNWDISEEEYVSEVQTAVGRLATAGRRVLIVCHHEVIRVAFGQRIRHEGRQTKVVKLEARRLGLGGSYVHLRKSITTLQAESGEESRQTLEGG